MADNENLDDERRPTSVLSLVWRVREGTLPHQAGVRVTRREYLDFVVDGKSLHDALSLGDLVGFMADWPYAPPIDELLPGGRSELESVIEGVGQRLLYVCPECGDAQCGATTATIAEERGRIVWKDFANLYWDWEATEDRRPVFDTEQFEHIGPFYFDRQQYVDALRNPPPRLVR